MRIEIYDYNIKYKHLTTLDKYYSWKLHDGISESFRSSPDRFWVAVL